MSVQHANIGVVKKDLQLYYNREFSKCFRGEATTNLIGTYGVGAANAYPSAGNNWGTYRDSLYNSGVPASIGTIASVSVDNVITVSSPTSYFNSFATYDVIQPQSTGGGVTAGTNYYFKRLTSTTFTLHQYDSTDDASKTPEQVLTYINSDTRISVNGTSFPTVWWGAPHLPNVALIKTAITNGFAYDNRFHDCIRLNWFRSDRTDGMAYGVQPSYTANTQYTFSCYIRASAQAAIGNSIYFTLYFTGTATGAGGFSCPALTSGWQKWTQTFTTSGSPGAILFYFWINHSSPSSVDIAEMQLDQKTYPTEFTPTSRAANTVAGGGGLLDISGNNVNADLTNVSFNNTGYFFNSASSNRIIAKTYTATDPFWLNLGSISIWFKTSTNQNGVLVGWGDDGNTNFGSIEITADWTGSYADESLIAESYTASANQRAVIRKGSNYYANGVWTNITAVFDDNYLNLKIYINGVLETTSNNGSSSGAPFLNVSTSTSYFNIGRRTYGAGSEYFTGEIGQTMVYGRLLTAAEVSQNFNATRKTYGI
jgi:hypothetical protein